MVLQQQLLPTLFNFQEQYLQNVFMLVSLKNLTRTELAKKPQFGIHFKQELMAFTAQTTTRPMPGIGTATMPFYWQKAPCLLARQR